jgi:hypothetical protein
VFVWKWELSLIAIVLEAHAVINRSTQTDGQTLVHAVILDCRTYFTYNKAKAAHAVV